LFNTVLASGSRARAPPRASQAISENITARQRSKSRRRDESSDNSIGPVKCAKREENDTNLQSLMDRLIASRVSPIETAITVLSEDWIHRIDDSDFGSAVDTLSDLTSATAWLALRKAGESAMCKWLERHANCIFFDMEE